MTVFVHQDHCDKWRLAYMIPEMHHREHTFYKGQYNQERQYPKEHM